MPTLQIDLDGYTDLPPGKIANVVTFLERRARPDGAPAGEHNGCVVRHVKRPDPSWYRELYRRIGEEWLWFSRAVMPDGELRQILEDPATMVLALGKDGIASGLAEMTFAVPGEVEIDMFGVVPEATGTGAARFLMDHALARAFAPGVERVWLHTCTFDHPAAVPFYLGRGFTAWKYAIEVADDPRLTGHLSDTAARHVPVIRGK